MGDATDGAGTEVTAFQSFDEAASAVVEFLQRRFGFQLWTVTRTSGEDWVILQAADRGYEVKPGKTFRWSDTFCSRMAVGEGPRVAPRSSDIPAYKDAPIAEQIPINAYVGVPIVTESEGLFGTLCAIDPTAQDPEVVNALPLVELLGRFLSSLAEQELKSQEEERLAQIQQLTKSTRSDGVLDEAGLVNLIESEDRRAGILASPVSLISIRSDYARGGRWSGKNPEEIAAAISSIVRSNASPNEAVALAADLVTVVLPETDGSKARIAAGQLENVLREEGIMATMRVATRTADRDLWEAADEAGVALVRR